MLGDFGCQVGHLRACVRCSAVGSASVLQGWRVPIGVDESNVELREEEEAPENESTKEQRNSRHNRHRNEVLVQNVY